MRTPPRVVAWLVFSLVAGSISALLDGHGVFLRGWAAYSLLIALGTGSLYLFWRWLRPGSAGEPAEANRDFVAAGWAALAAFLLRLAVGVALTLLLPVLGHQDAAAQASRAGYFYQDAAGRDRQAWNLAQSGAPLSVAFDPDRSKDQYGSLLFLSMLVYRFLSPDAHRQMLILALTAAAGAWGVLFVWKAAGAWFGDGAARAAGWTYALYPEAVLLSASQMREGFVLSGTAIALCGVILATRGMAHGSQARRGSREVPGQGRAPGWVWFGVGILLLLVFHPPSALVTLVVLGGIWLLEPGRKHFSLRQLALFGGVLLVAALLVFAAWSRLPSLRGESPAGVISAWLANNINFQAYQSVRASGWLQKLIDEAGEAWKGPILIAYGVAQPVLPGAIFEEAPLIWRIVNSLRGLGWYALAPLLVYAVTAMLRLPRQERKAQLAWFSLATWAWILIASANAGGDLWDNPRYRAIFLAFQALLAAWAWRWALDRRDPWLRRLLWVEAVFVLFFMEWYASRYTRLFSRLHFWEMIASILALSAAILLVGWLRDRRRIGNRQPASHGQ